jgi:hypothetical protein
MMRGAGCPQRRLSIALLCHMLGWCVHTALVRTPHHAPPQPGGKRAAPAGPLGLGAGQRTGAGASVQIGDPRKAGGFGSASGEGLSKRKTKTPLGLPLRLKNPWSPAAGSRHQIESPKRRPRNSTQGRLPLPKTASINECLRPQKPWLAGAGLAL